MRARIAELYNILTGTANTYDRTLQQAVAAYNDDPSETKPDFTAWLGTLPGRSWSIRIASDTTNLEQAQRNYDGAVLEARTPNLNERLEAYDNKDYWAKLNDPNLLKMPAVPNWSTPQTAQQWKDSAARGDVPSGEIGFTNSDSAYNFGKTWAEGSVKVGSWFWSVKVGAKWERIDEFAADANLTAAVNFEGIEQMAIQPSDWHMGVGPLVNGPYKQGYSAYGGGGTVAAFGKDGFLPMLKTGMYVTYKPGFNISVNQSTFKRFSEKFSGAAGLRIGPFEFEAKGGSEKAGWEASESSRSFRGTSTSAVPAIFGLTFHCCKEGGTRRGDAQRLAFAAAPRTPASSTPTTTRPA